MPLLPTISIVHQAGHGMQIVRVTIPCQPALHRHPTLILHVPECNVRKPETAHKHPRTEKVLCSDSDWAGLFA